MSRDTSNAIITFSLTEDNQVNIKLSFTDSDFNPENEAHLLAGNAFQALLQWGGVPDEEKAE